jgi:Domain of unknown function (DUF4382)
MRTRLALAALSLFALAACSDDNSNGDTTRLSIRLTDAPGDITTAVVTVSEIYLQGSDGRVVLRDQDTTLNLVDLANATADMVNGAVVPQGTYEQLRFVITGAYISVEQEGGTQRVYATSPNYAGLPAGTVVDGNLQTPSFSTSGVKVQLPGDELVLGSADQTLLVDFDVAQSFGKQAGNSGQWVMNPVIKGADITVSGGLIVNATLATGVTATLGEWNAQITPAGGSAEHLLLTDPDLDGTFSANFRYLLPGTYSVTLLPPTGTFASTPVLPVDQAVASDANTTVNVTVDSYTP